MKNKNSQDNSSSNKNDQQASQMPLTVLNQYIKDFSFENPNPDLSFQDSNEAPEMNLNLDIQANNPQDNIYEITLNLKAEAKRSSKILFIVELEYTGIFQLGNVPQESIHPLLMIECPRLLFPAARHLIATITREGGFPTLSLEPIDFVELYRKQYIEAQQPEPAASPEQSNKARLDS